MPSGGSRKYTGPKVTNSKHGQPGRSNFARGTQPLTAFFPNPSSAINEEHIDDDIDNDDNANEHDNTAEEEEEVFEDAREDLSDEEEDTNLGREEEVDDEESDSGLEDEPNLQNPDLPDARMNGRSITGIIEKQRRTIINGNKTNAQRIRSLVEKGVFKEEPKQILWHHIKPSEMKDSWQRFNEAAVFHWVPSVMLQCQGKKWLPMCPNACGARCTGNGFNKDPRYVYGLHENYFLNAPERYKCEKCKDARKLQIETNISPKEAKRCEWHSLSNEVLEQVRSENPGLFYSFPCVLSHINAVDKDLLRTVQDFARKGVGPSAVADILLSWHEQRWQEKEIKWLCHLASRMEEPLATVEGDRDSKEDLRNVERMPSYFSDECCGGTPSASYLINTFCKSIDRKRSYYDKETLRRMKNSLMIAIDASFKVGKWMMRHGDQKVFEALQTGLNEYGEIIMQRWSTSDNHTELGEHLKQLKELGLEPWWVFSDVPEKDSRMLREIFESLNEDVDDGAVERANQSAAASSNLELVPADLEQCVYVTTPPNAEAIIHRMEEALTRCCEGSKKILYFDAEWPVYTDEQTRKRGPGKVNIIQLHCPVEDDTSYYLLELGSFRSTRSVLSLLGNLLSREDIFVVGANHKSDITKIRKDYKGEFLVDEGDLDQVAKNLRDVQAMAKNRGAVVKGVGCSLKALCRSADYYLPKPDDIRCGTMLGSRNNLPDDGKRYCMRDLVALKIVYQKYILMPILTSRLQDADIEVGMEVDIMPQDRASCDPIATGSIIPSDGDERKTLTKIKLKTSSGQRRYLIQIKEVYDKDGLLHFGRVGKQSCGCCRLRHGAIKESCTLYCYGQVRVEDQSDFKVVEESCRLRKAISTVTLPRRCNAPQTNEQRVFYDGDLGDEDGESYTDESDDIVNDDYGGESEDDDDHFDVALSSLTDLFEVEECVDAVDSEVNEVLGEEYCSNKNNHPGAPVHESADNIDTLADEADAISKILSDCDAFSRETFGLHAEDFQFLGDEAVDGYLDVTKNMVLSRVLADAFHVMDRAKVPINHCYKASYFVALRGAMFIMNPEDVKNLRDAYSIDEAKWRRILAFDFQFIAKRVRRRIPPPTILHARVKAVYDYFQDKKDFNTNKPLFNAKAKEKSENILKMIENGFISDPPGISFYVEVLNSDGTPKLDKKGLQLYRSIRGTSMVESFHELLTRCFGHTQAGAYYSDCLLTLVRHTHNWRASMKNRPGFPQLRHYDGEAIDIVNDMYEFCFGEVKYPNWIGCGKVHLGNSPFGIVKSGSENNSSSDVRRPETFRTAHDYVAFRQGSDVACLPVYGEAEYKLFSKLMKIVISDGKSMNSQTVFKTMATEWNVIVEKQKELGNKGIYFRKTESYLARHYKRWRETQKKREAASKVSMKRVMDAVQYTPNVCEASTSDQVFNSLGIDEASLPTQKEAISDIGGSNNTDDDEEAIGSSISNRRRSGKRSQAAPRAGQRGKKQKKQRKTCLYPNCTNSKCTGGINKAFCRARKMDNPNLPDASPKQCTYCFANLPTARLPSEQRNAYTCKGRGGKQHCPHYKSLSSNK